MSNGNSTLIAHEGVARIVTLEELRTVPTPEGTKTHKPVPHYALVESVLERLSERRIEVAKMQLAVSANNMQVFGALDLKTDGERYGGLAGGLALGLRAANDKSLAVQMVAGARVLVCDNLVLSGQAIVLRRKHTRHLALAYEINASLDRYMVAEERFTQSVTALAAVSLTDMEAKAAIFDLCYAGTVPVSMFDDIGRNYFDAEKQGFEDCAPRSRWGLHNAATRAIKALSPASQFQTNMALGRAFDITAN